MASDNPQIVGQNEILSFEEIEEITVGEPFHIFGNINGNIKSNTIKLFINQEEINSIEVHGNNFSFTHTINVAPSTTVDVTVQGRLNNEIKSTYTRTIPITNTTIAGSIATAYIMLSNILEDKFSLQTTPYNPITKEGEGLMSLILKTKEL